MLNKESNNDNIRQKKKVILSIGSWALAFISAVLVLRQLLEYLRWREIYKTLEWSVSQSIADQWNILNVNPLLYPTLALIFGVISFKYYQTPNQQ